MSSEAVVRFREAVNGNEALKTELREMPRVTSRELAEMAARHGYEFTPKEFAEVANLVRDELTDFELELVAGGTQELICWRQGMRAAESVAPLPPDGGTDDDDGGC